MLYILSRQNININFKLNFFCDPCALIYIGVSSWKCMFFTLPLPPNTCMCNLNNCGDKGFYTAAMNFSYIFSFFFYLSFGCFVDYIFFSFSFGFTGHTIYFFPVSLLLIQINRDKFVYFPTYYYLSKVPTTLFSFTSMFSIFFSYFFLFFISNPNKALG